MKRDHASRQVFAAVFLLAPFVSGNKSFPARLPPAASIHNAVFWVDSSVPPSDGDDGTDEIESSSDDDNDDWVGVASSSSQLFEQDSTAPIPIPTIDETISATDQAVSYQSQSLQTIEKLQQMLEDSDYITATKTAEQGILRKTAKERRDQVSKPDNNTTSKKRLPLNTRRHGVDEVTRTAPHNIQVKQSDTMGPSSLSQSRLRDHAHASSASPSPPVEPLWQSKDRTRYKLQQLKVRQAIASREKAASEPNSQAVTNPAASHYQRQGASQTDDDASDDTDDGLGYSLPNLPVYVSDAEVDSEEQEIDGPGEAARQQSTRFVPQGDTTGASQLRHPSHNYYYPYQQQTQASGQQQLSPPLPPQHPPPPAAYQQQQPMAPESAYQQQHQQLLPHDAYRQHVPMYAPYGYPPNYPYPYPPYGQYTLPQHPTYSTSNGKTNYWPGPGQQLAQHQNLNQRVEGKKQERGILSKEGSSNRRHDQSPTVRSIDNVFIPPDFQTLLPPPFYASHPTNLSPAIQLMEQSQTLAEASSKVNADALVKMSLLLAVAALACYSGVSPRALPLSEYNLQFYENIRLVSMSIIAPCITAVSVFDARENDFNVWINSFFVSFTFGYALIFAAEIVCTTLIRLAVFCWFEPGIYSLTPKIPLPVLPWVLKDVHYRPKRITLIAADVAASCVIAPIIEEYTKLKLLEWTTRLPKNFKWELRESKRSKKRKRKVAEAVIRLPGQKDTTNANKFVTQMLAVSLGVKMCDTGRRILMYTKGHHESKGFYSLCRGIFPIQELCGTMTALALAKRDLLGVDYKTWQVLFPAVVLHAMANFRGMKPIFKWNSATPWSEMQLSPLNKADQSTLLQLLKKGYAKLMWLIILGRVLGYCIKNYYMVNRQALKRTTTYAGKHAAFSAELATAEILKKQK